MFDQLKAYFIQLDIHVPGVTKKKEQQKRNDRVLEFCFIPTVIPLTLLDRTSSIL